MLLPALIMLSITIVTVGLLLLPMKLKQRSKLIRFYWVGFWVFLVIIASLSGLEQTIRLAGYDISMLTQRLLIGTIAAFMVFVIFAWFRLTGAALISGFRRVMKTA